MQNLKNIHIKLQSLVIFRNLLDDEVITKLSKLLASQNEDTVNQVQKYAAFTSALLCRNENLTQYIFNLAIVDDNIYVKKIGNNLTISSLISEALDNELEILSEISHLTSDSIKKTTSFKGFLPSWETEDIDFKTAYHQSIDRIGTCGYGIFAKYIYFTTDKGELIPVSNHDVVSLEDLKGYEKEKDAVLKNTLALLNSKPAANVLLYGDAGTGKSSTVKAIVNRYYSHGLRLVEVPKDQLKYISLVLDKLSKNPLKFIIYIDDLSFTKNDNELGSLKAILEGSVSAKPLNTAIYATSNRRHLIKETFSDREGDDIHLNETIQELTSLSDRFGLLVSFFRPDKRNYLDIVQKLAIQYGIDLSKEELESEAEIFAAARSGRSPRIARQFIEYLQTLQ
ncbi:MAG: ATP-binding protein [Eubacteriales bacterium]|nr:ATP-binding protein [Eubacteriales bacterium]